MLLNGRNWWLNQGDGTFRLTLSLPTFYAFQKPIITDLTADGVPDLVVVSREQSTAFVITECGYDCDDDGYSDAEEIAFCDDDPNCADCDQNGIPDGCDLAFDENTDCNANGVHDACEQACHGDWDDDGIIQTEENLRLVERLTGPDVIVAGDCSAHQLAIYDADHDGDLDMVDFRSDMLWVDRICPW